MRRNDGSILADRPAIATHGADPERVYVAGVSRGGWMTYRLMAEIPHKFSAFATVLAGMEPSRLKRYPGLFNYLPGRQNGTWKWRKPSGTSSARNAPAIKRAIRAPRADASFTIRAAMLKVEFLFSIRTS